MLSPKCRVPLMLAVASSCATNVAQGNPNVFSNNGGELYFSMTAAGLDTPNGIAAAWDASAYYVSGKSSDTMYVFDAVGSFLFSFTDVGLSAPAGIAITSDDAPLYVCSSGTNDVKVFSSTGDFLFSFTGDGAADPTDVVLTSDDSVVYVANGGTNDVKVFDATGTFLFSFSRPDMNLDPTGIALTSDDAVVYVANAALDTVEVFASDGTHLDTIAAAGIDDPTDVSLTSDDSLVYITNAATRTVEVLDAVGSPVLSIGGTGSLGPDCELTLTLEDSAFAVTNFTSGDCAISADGDPCDDGEFCTVQDVCTVGVCGGSPRDCSDGLFCNGEEACVSGACIDQVDPCPGACDEQNNSCLSPLGLPANPEHHARKHRYISIDATTNLLNDVSIKLEIAEMNRCQNDLRRSCVDDQDCPTVCAAEPDLHSCGDGSMCPDGVCIESGPCVPHPDVGLSWYVQEPQTRGADCPNGMCDEQDY